MEKEKTNKVKIVFLRVLVSILLVILIGIISGLISILGAKVYRTNSYGRVSGFFSSLEKLDPVFGMLGIIIFIIINIIGFLIYNYLIKKLNKNNGLIEKIIYIISSAITNWLMLIVYFNLFDEFIFENRILNSINILVVEGGLILFPIVFSITYLCKKYIKKKIRNEEE